MSDAPSPEACHWAEQAVGHGAKVISVRSLDGATSSAVYALTLSQNQQAIKLVLRLFTNRQWLAEEPHLVRHEAECLLLAQQLDVCVPELVAVDEEGRCTGHPAILMTRLPGQVHLTPTNLPDWLDELAATLIKIHTLPAPDFDWPYYSWLDPERFIVPTWAQSPRVWEQAIEIVSQPVPDEPRIFIHRDYHPTNVLWQGGAISGVVDWVNGCRGPVGEDISHCRVNLIRMYGLEAAEHFLAAYQALAPDDFAYDPFWDVAAVMDTSGSFHYPPWQQFGLTVAPVDILQARTERFLQTAVQQLQS